MPQLSPSRGLAGPHHRGHFSPPLPRASSLIVSGQTPCPSDGVRSPGHSLIKLSWNDDTQSVFSSHLPVPARRVSVGKCLGPSHSPVRSAPVVEAPVGPHLGRAVRMLRIQTGPAPWPTRAEPPALLPGLPAALALASYLPALTLERLSSIQRSCLLPKPLQFLSSRQRQTADGLI